MTTVTDVKQRLAALYATLADATKACNIGPYHKRHFKNGCQGTGKVARFPEFRQDKPCPHAGLVDDVGVSWDPDKCPRCNGRGWQDRAGSTDDGLAGLSPTQAANVLWMFQHWVNCPKPYTHLHEDGEIVLCESRQKMPSALEIRAEGLRLICEIAELEVPDA